MLAEKRLDLAGCQAVLLPVCLDGEYTVYSIHEGDFPMPELDTEDLFRPGRVHVVLRGRAGFERGPGETVLELRTNLSKVLDGVLRADQLVCAQDEPLPADFGGERGGEAAHDHEGDVAGVHPECTDGDGRIGENQVVDHGVGAEG